MLSFNNHQLTSSSSIITIIVYHYQISSNIIIEYHISSSSKIFIKYQHQSSCSASLSSSTYPNQDLEAKLDEQSYCFLRDIMHEICTPVVLRAARRDTPAENTAESKMASAVPFFCSPALSFFAVLSGELQRAPSGFGGRPSSRE